MKKIICILLTMSLLCSCAVLTSCGGSSSDSLKSTLKGNYDVESLKGTVLNVFNWGEYMSLGADGELDVNKAFEEVTGIKVNYTTYESNEQMYSKMKSGAVSYDIVIPSDYMIERMISENMLQKLDMSKITNYGNIDEQYKNLYFDKNNEYSVPYNVGLVGLIYNKAMTGTDIDSWTAMWDEKYKDNILTFNNPRDAFMIAQIVLGQDLNSTDPMDWYKAAEKLKEQNPLLQGRVMDEIFNKMESANAAIAPYYAGDYLMMKENNEDLEFVYPKEGTNIFVDSVCVPKDAQNYDAAMLYINFLLETEIALANAESICYASPNTTVVNNDNYTYKGNKILYPDKKDMPKCEYYHDLNEKIRTYYETLWEEVLNTK